MLTDRVDYDISLHEIDRNAALLEAIGVATNSAERRSWLLPDKAVLWRIRERYAGSRPVIVIAPGSVWRTKQWTPEGFVGVARRLRDAGYRVILSGSRDERPLCASIATAAGVPVEDVVAGELGLAEVCALMALAERVITNDSAPLHLAESLGIPVTAVFGPTVPEFGFGPRDGRSSVVEMTGLACRPCGIHGAHECPIGTWMCMRGVTADMVTATFGASIG